MKRINQRKNASGKKPDYHALYLKNIDYQRRYREAHREKYREYSMQYRVEHPRKPLGDRRTQAIYEVKDPVKLHRYLERELSRIKGKN